MDNCVIAKYIRLSLEDGKSDSVSIESQRLLLDHFIADSEYDDASVLEFVDNGFSGTNFERPGVQELLELIREGKVNCVVVKDFSRFGRNAIETGYFIERVFPFFGVRFISVEDHFDSSEHLGDTGGLEISFKFLMHEYYSRDLSKKITTAKREKMRCGKAVSTNCAYGYKLDSERKMVVDPPAAEVVQHIFALYSEGASLADIEKRLYEEGRPTPATYKKQKRRATQDERFACVWQKSVVLSILRDERYTGIYIAGKTKVKDHVTHTRMKTDENNWIRIPGHHPAIISQELFDIVQERLNVKGEPLRKRDLHTSKRYAGCDDSSLKGKVFCGHCGHSLRISCTKNAAFHCWFTRSAPDAPCHGLRALKSELEDAVYEIITRQSEAILGTETAREAVASQVGAKQQADCKEKFKKLHDQKRGLYERLILDEVDEERYMMEKAGIEVELNRLARVLDGFAAQEEKVATSAKLRKIAHTALESGGLTQGLVDLLIDKILIYPDNHMEIHWKIADFGNDIKNMEGKRNVG